MLANSAFNPHTFIDDIALLSRIDDKIPNPDDGIGRQCYAFSEQEHKAQRRAEQQVRGILKHWNRVEYRDFEIWRTTLGSLVVHYFGRDRSLPPFMIHSHLDSVKEGGKYDGVAGVAAGIGILAYIVQSSIPPERGLIFVAWVSEESSPYNGVGCLGSSVSTGTISESALNAIVYRSGEKLRDRFSSHQWKLVHSERSNPFFTGARIAGALELHIEQSTVIAQSKRSIGIVVDGIGGACRLKMEKPLRPLRILEARKYDLHTLEFFGTADHTGGTPPNPSYFRRTEDGILYRKDALIASSHAMIEVLRIPKSRLISSEPLIEGGFTAVPSRQMVKIAIPKRSRRKAIGMMTRISSQTAERFGVTLRSDCAELTQGTYSVGSGMKRYLNIPRIVGALSTKAYRREKTSYGTTRATVTDFHLTPEGITFKLDLREVNHEHFARLHQSINARLMRTLGCLPTVVSEKKSQPVSRSITRGIRHVAEQLGVTYVEMPSVPGQDSDRLAAAGVPVGMIFIRQADGISHSPYERMDPRDFDTAFAVAREYTRRALSA